MQKSYQGTSSVVLRLAMAGVVMWFGVSQLSNQNLWVGFIPDWAVSLSHLSAVTLVRLNGVFEVVTGLLLAVGLWVRLVAAFLFGHLLSIVFDVGLNSLGVRDAGLSFALLAVALNGSDVWCFGSKEEKVVEVAP